MDSPMALGYLGCICNYLYGIDKAINYGMMGFSGLYWLVRDGYLEVFLSIFRYLRDLRTRPYLKGQKPIRLQSIEIIQSAC